MLPAESSSPVTGLTPNELAKLLRVSPDRVRGWIVSGQLQAINVADHTCGKPRYVVLPHHLAAFEQRRNATPPVKTTWRRKRTKQVDFYPD
jgi:hypothetical protein